MAVRPVPEGYHTVTPYLTVRDLRKLLDYVQKAFDATDVNAMTMPDGTIRHAEFQIGDSKLMAGEASEKWEPRPGTLYPAVWLGRDRIRFADFMAAEFPRGVTGTPGHACVGPIAYLLGSDLEKVEVSGLELTIASSEEPMTATLERAWIDDPRPRAGRTVPLKVLLRTYRGDEEVRTLPITLPANATGTLSLTVTDGGRLGQLEQRETRAPQQVRTIDQAIKVLNKARHNRTLYVKLLGSEAGAVVNGELLSSLPPSVLAVLEADRNSGTFNPVRSATLAEWELATERSVSGSRTLSLTVSPN